MIDRIDSELSSNPFKTPADFRAYVYDFVILPWEMTKTEIRSEIYSKKAVQQCCGLHILKFNKLSDSQGHDQGTWSKNEFLIFHNQGKGYECLFKRLRDTFAHGHYWQEKRGWISLRHRYPSPRQKMNNTYLFGNLKIITFKKLIEFLNPPHGATIA